MILIAFHYRDKSGNSYYYERDGRTNASVDCARLSNPGWMMACMMCDYCKGMDFYGEQPTVDCVYGESEEIK